MVGVAGRAKGLAGVEHVQGRDVVALGLEAHGEVEVVLGHPLAQVGAAQVLALLAKGVVEVERVDRELVGHHDVGVVGHALGNPVVAAHRLEPPDLVDVLEGDAVHLVGAIALKQAAQTQHALAGRTNVGKHEREHVLLADAAGHLGQGTAGGLQAHKRVGAKHALVGGERLGLAHGDVGLVDACLAPDAFLKVGVGHAGVAHGLLGQVNLEMGDDTAIVARLVGGLHDVVALGRELAAGCVLIARDDGRPIVAGVLANKQSSARHVGTPLTSKGRGHTSAPPVNRTFTCS